MSVTVAEMIERCLVNRKSVFGCGGNRYDHLHIFLEDWNYDDGSLKFCIESATQGGDEEALGIARDALTLSKTQRLKLLNKLKRLDCYGWKS